MKEFTGPEWEGWIDLNGFVFKKGWEIYVDGGMYRDNNFIGDFPTPEAARQVVELIKAAEAGKPIPTLKEVAELVAKLDTAVNGDGILESEVEEMIVTLATMKEKYGL